MGFEVRRRWLWVVLGGFGLYVGSYLVFRSTHSEVWERDGREYVIFPAASPIVYYGFRPLTYVDGLLTEMRFHIGPHGA